MTTKRASAAARNPPAGGAHEWIIATTWIEDSPWGIELQEDENPFAGASFDEWMATGNFAICKGLDSLEDFIRSSDKDIKELYAYSRLEPFLKWIEK